jgi:uncharacterized membrane protein
MAIPPSLLRHPLTRASRPLLRYLIRGAIVLAPVTGTAYVSWWALSTLDRLLPIGIPGLGLLLTICIVTLVGWLASSVVGASFLDVFERWLGRLPLIKLVYSSLKDLIDAFVGDKKRFDRPVAVALDGRGDVKMLGFVTRDALSFIHDDAFVGVYFPQSYNFAGNVLLVRRDRIEALDVASGDLMTFIVSGGVSGFGRGETLLPPDPPTREMPVLQRQRELIDAPTALASDPAEGPTQLSGQTASTTPPTPADPARTAPLPPVTEDQDGERRVVVERPGKD